MKKELTPQDQSLIKDEVDRYSKTYKRIQDELRAKTHALSDDEKTSRALTAQLVNEKNEEEKQFLQSDENVAHGLAHLRYEQVNALSDLTKQAYFARVIYNEKGRDVEFKLGVASFPEERIIDWRKAPISTLYYDYEEGDEYEDEIAGVERHGTVKLKRAYRAKYDQLTHIELKDASYQLSRGHWQKFKKQVFATFSLKEKKKVRELLKQQEAIQLDQITEEEGYLSQILALLSPEQFRLISSDLSHPVVIQGSAGTGKTTVALHRLAWLLFEGNSPAKEENTLVVMFNPTLVKYVQKILPSLGIHKVQIVTYLDWARDVLKSSVGQVRIREWTVPSVVAGFKASDALLKKLKIFYQNSSHKSLHAILQDFYSSSDWVSSCGLTTGSHGNSEIPDQVRNDNKRIKSYLENQIRKDFLDIHDVALLLELVYERDGCYTSQKYPAELDHLVIDEAQDFTHQELKTLLYALKDKMQLTIAGDLGQKILQDRDFGSWRELLDQLGLTGVDVLNLSIAYRSTYQIYEIAEYVRDPSLSDEDLKMHPKFGPEPKLTMAHNFDEAVTVAKSWIEDVVNINQKIIGAVVCRNQEEAKKLYQNLLRLNLHGIRLGNAQHFEFTPGITITDVTQVKGLEFQAVLLFDPSEAKYSQQRMQERNLLYVAITRAVYKIDFLCYGKPSQMLPDFIQAVDLTKVEEEEDPNKRFLFDRVEEIEKKELSEEQRDMLDELTTGAGIEDDVYDVMDDDLNGLSVTDESEDM